MNDVELSWALSKSATQAATLECELRAERELSRRWQNLAGRYDDIRYWLRACPDTPEGHELFYRWAAHLIFPDTNPEPPE